MRCRRTLSATLCKTVKCETRTYTWLPIHKNLCCPLYYLFMYGIFYAVHHILLYIIYCCISCIVVYFIFLYKIYYCVYVLFCMFHIIYCYIHTIYMCHIFQLYIIYPNNVGIILVAVYRKKLTKNNDSKIEIETTFFILSVTNIYSFRNVTHNSHASVLLMPIQ